MFSSREIGSKGNMLEGVPLGPVDSYIHSALFSTGISIESFLGENSIDRYASVASVICRWHMQRREWLARPEGICQHCKNKSQRILHWKIKVCITKNIGYIVQIHKQISWLDRLRVSKIRVNKMKRWHYASALSEPQLYGKIEFIKLLKRFLTIFAS